MKFAKFRTFALTCTVIALAGPALAEQSETTQPPPAATPAASTSVVSNSGITGVPSTEEAAKVLHVSKDYIKRVSNIGFHIKNHKGQLVFCKKEPQIGTRFETEQCMDSEQLTMLLEHQEAQRDEMRQPACAKGGLICGQAK